MRVRIVIDPKFEVLLQAGQYALLYSDRRRVALGEWWEIVPPEDGSTFCALVKRVQESLLVQPACRCEYCGKPATAMNYERYHTGDIDSYTPVCDAHTEAGGNTITGREYGSMPISTAWYNAIHGSGAALRAFGKEL